MPAFLFNKEQAYLEVTDMIKFCTAVINLMHTDRQDRLRYQMDYLSLPKIMSHHRIIVPITTYRCRSQWCYRCTACNNFLAPDSLNEGRFTCVWCSRPRAWTLTSAAELAAYDTSDSESETIQTSAQRIVIDSVHT